MQYTKEALILIIQYKAKELGKIPTKRDIKQQTPIKKIFGSWNNALAAAGFEHLKQRTFTAESIIEIFHTWIHENKRIPTTNDLNTDKILPDSKVIKRYLHMGYRDFIISLGYEPFDGTVYTQSDNELLQLLKNEIMRLGTTKKNVFMSQRNKDVVPSVTYYETHFNRRWNRILLLSGISKDNLCGFQYTREELIQILQELHTEFGKAPSQKNLEQLGYSRHIFTNMFQNYNNALIAAGITPMNKTPEVVKATDEELLQMYVDFSNCLGQADTTKQLNESHNIYNADFFALRFGGMLELQKRAGLVSTYGTRKAYSKQGLAEKLKRVYKLNGGRIPIRRLKDFGLCASTLMRYFQTTKINEIWEEIEKEIMHDNQSLRE
ncbi:homing endonuclease associated repeat-containing protein [Bacillus mycoides]|uniref:homing endonuclease associated repeat-containing protein n=1 Tax=Bacillus mycoides TaxID=1405 RepID=UPI003D03911F